MIHRKAAKTKRSHPGKKSQIDPDLKPPERDRTRSVLQLQRIIGNQAIGRLIQTPMKIGRPNLRPLTAPTPNTTFRVVQRKKFTRRKASEKAAAEIVKLLEELHGIITLKLATSRIGFQIKALLCCIFSRHSFLIKTQPYPDR